MLGPSGLLNSQDWFNLIIFFFILMWMCLTVNKQDDQTRDSNSLEEHGDWNWISVSGFATSLVHTLSSCCWCISVKSQTENYIRFERTSSLFFHSESRNETATKRKSSFSPRWCIHPGLGDNFFRLRTDFEISSDRLLNKAKILPDRH